VAFQEELDSRNRQAAVKGKMLKKIISRFKICVLYSEDAHQHYIYTIIFVSYIKLF